MTETENKAFQEIHEIAKKNFDKIQNNQQDEREQCLDDRRFYSVPGAMWEGDYQKQYENKPKLELNKIHLSIIKIFNEFRNNPISVNFLPKSGEKNQELSDTINGLLRSDEQDSDAEEAYDNAFEEGVGGGIGAWRLTPQLEDEYDDEDEYQRIMFEPIYDADTCVYWDINAKKYDKSDARYCYVLTKVDKDTFIEEYGEDPISWPKIVDNSHFDWYSEDGIYIAEYFKVEKVKGEKFIYKNESGKRKVFYDVDFEMEDGLKLKLDATGYKLKETKSYTRKRVHKYLMSGSQILEDQGYIPGPNIPIIPFYGKRWFVDGQERCMGHVRLSKDAQRLFNVLISKLLETSQFSDHETPIVTPEQIQGHETEWENHNIKNYAYLQLNSIEDAEGNIVPSGPVDYTRVPNVPPVTGTLIQLVDSAMKEILGNQQIGEDIVSNVSGKAVELIQNRIDMQSFIYMDNFAKSMKRSGQVYIGMAKEVYVESGRKMKTLGKNNEVSSITLGEQIINPETQDLESRNDIAHSKMGVHVSIGPSSDSKRKATVSATTQMLQMTNDPEDASVLRAFAFMNMEGEGIEDLRSYGRNKLIKMGVTKPTQEELERMVAEAEAAKNQPPDANEIYLQSAAMKEQAEAQQKQADTMKKIAETQKIEAETRETEATTLEKLQGLEDQGNNLNGENEPATFQAPTMPG